KFVTGVDDHVAGSDDGNPDKKWLLHPGRTGFRKLRPAIASEFATIRATIRNNRPSVVQSRFHDVDLVPTLRTMVSLPQLAGLWMNHHSQGIPEAHRVDLRLIPRLSKERIVRRDAAIVIESQDLASMAARILGLSDVRARRHTNPQKD